MQKRLLFFFRNSLSNLDCKCNVFPIQFREHQPSAYSTSDANETVGHTGRIECSALCDLAHAGANRPFSRRLCRIPYRQTHVCFDL